MKNVFIYPKIFSFFSLYQDMELLLYHECLQSEDYINFYIENKNYKIFDNSFYEIRKEIDYDDFIKLGEKMQIDEVILPDKLWDGDWTRKAVKDNLKNYYNIYKKNNWKIASVLQGKYMEDIEDTLEYYLKEDKIDVIMIPRKIWKNKKISYYAGRINVWNHILDKYFDNLLKKEIHFLGANSLGDFFLPNKQYIRSIDSKLITKTLADNWKWKNWEDDSNTKNIKPQELEYFIKYTLQNYYGEI